MNDPTTVQWASKSGYRIERVHEPSHVRRGRLSVDPVWYVVTPEGGRQKFQRLRDARQFIAGRVDDGTHEPGSQGAT